MSLTYLIANNALHKGDRAVYTHLVNLYDL